MEQCRRPVSFLASVRSESEARLCVSLGADIIDAKDPLSGALGALSAANVAAIRRCVPGHVPVSATIGDLPADPDRVSAAVVATAASGVDVVKVGLCPGGDAEATLRRLGGLALGDVRLVGVLLADQRADLSLIAQMSDAGFVGVMLDTADKVGGALPDLLTASQLRAFIEIAHENELFAGLAGSLRAQHVRELFGLGADVLGFRGGLCLEGLRTAAIDADAIRTVRDAIPRAKETLIRPCRVAATSGIAPSQPEGAL